MKRSRFGRALAVLLCMLLCLTPLDLTMSVAAESTTAAPKIAYVPLDDRPVNVDRVIYEAEAAGFEILMPDADLYETHLDNQSTNSNGTKYGDGTAIMNWLKTVEDECDWFVISLDQMFSGGLVNSRATYRDYVTEEECAIIDYLVALSDKPNKHVYFVDTVMRLASTSGYDGYTDSEYNALRTYGSQERKLIDTSNFRVSDYDSSLAQVQAIYQSYQTGKSGETLSFDTSVLSQDQINQYHKARTRKLQLINLMMQYANRSCTYFVGVDDASPNDNIQRNEINFIETRMALLGLDCNLSADTDSACMMAVARCVTDYYGATPTVRVRYYGGRENYAADDYDIGTLVENVDSHLTAAGCRQVTTDGAELEMLILTQPSVASDATTAEIQTAYEGYIDQLMTQLKANLAARQPTIVVDASTNNYYSAWYGGDRSVNLQNRLCSEINLGELMGYSNWNTVGNALGIAVGQGVSRYTYLAHETNITDASHVAYLQSMTYAYIKDISFIAKNKAYFSDSLQAYITNTLGWNSGNFYANMMAYSDSSTYKEDWELSRGEHVINNELTWRMLQGGNASAYAGCGQQILDNLQASEIYTNLNGQIETRTVGTISVARFRFPWYRLFEMTFDITPTLGTTTHHYYFENATSGFLTKVPTQLAAASFITNLKEQYEATAVTVRNTAGVAVSSSQTLVGTGFTVTMTISGSNQSYTVVIPREVTGDGKVDSGDVRAVMEYTVGNYALSDAQFAAADQNSDGKVGSTDARRILQALL